MIQFSTPFTVINALEYTDGKSTKESSDQQKEVKYHFVILEVCATLITEYENTHGHLLDNVQPATDAMGAQWVSINDLECSQEWKDKAIAWTTLLGVIKQAQTMVKQNNMPFYINDPIYG